MNDDRLGPAFDTVTLIRPTPRKLACLWMEQAGLPTLLLPTVWEQLTRTRRRSASVNTASWRRLRSHNDAPFRWIELNDDQQEAVEDVLAHFTEPCFPKLAADQVPDDPDANIVAEALVLGTDVLVTQDINSINHDEINFVIEKRLGRNTGFVITLDRALSQAFPGGDCANHLLTLALATIAPTGQGEWPAEVAHQGLGKMLDALVGANVRDTAARWAYAGTSAGIWIRFCWMPRPWPATRGRWSSNACGRNGNAKRRRNERYVAVVGRRTSPRPRIGGRGVLVSSTMA